MISGKRHYIKVCFGGTIFGAPFTTYGNRLVCTFAGLGPQRQHIKRSEGHSEAGGLHSWRLLGASPQVAAELSEALQGGAALVLHPDSGQQDGHQGAEEDTQQRAPSSEEATAGVTPRRHSSHDDPRSNPPSSGDTVPHVYPPPARRAEERLTGGKTRST